MSKADKPTDDSIDEPVVEVFLTERALSDIATIRDYSRETWGEVVAENYLNEIDASLARIERFPHLLRQEPEFASRLLFYRTGKHLLVCDRIDDTVILLTVLHASLDLPRRIGDFEPNLITEAEILHKQLIASRKTPNR